MHRSTVITTITLISILLFVACSPETTDTASSASYNPERAEVEARAVEAALVTKGMILPRITASGLISGVDDIQLISETSGRIEEVFVRLGSPLMRDEEILRLDSSIQELNLQQALSNWETAKLDLEAAESFYEKGNASKSQLVRAQSSERGAKARYESAMQQLSNRTISSPINGILARIEPSVKAGNIISPGTPIGRIVNNNYMQIHLTLGERQIGLVKPGAPARISLRAYPDFDVLQGIVTGVAGASDPSTGSYQVIVSFENSYGDVLKSGMSARVEIEPQADPMILIPTAATFQQNDGLAVYAVEDDVAVMKEIRVGRKLGNRAEVLAGIAENDIVVLSRLSSLKPGERVDVTIIGESGTWR